jgi:hypothetical protein
MKRHSAARVPEETLTLVESSLPLNVCLVISDRDQNPDPHD